MTTHSGYYDKYQVQKRDDPDHVHDKCDFFVLDLTHDVYALAALRQYRNAMYGINEALAADLTKILNHYCTCIDTRVMIAPDCPIHGTPAPVDITLPPETKPREGWHF